MIWITFVIIPVLIAFGFFLFGGRNITLQEFVIQVGAQSLFAGLCVIMTHCSNTTDVEVWNGRVASKAKVEVSCSHDYQCNCYQSCSTDSKGSMSCSTHCSTCYEHQNDWDWMVYTTNSEGIEIDRIDRQGSDEPPRFAAVRIGEPTSMKHIFTNYIKAAPDSLFQRQGLVEKWVGQLPEYPQTVYDYYRLNRIVGSVPDQNFWNLALSELNADLGKAKQVNIILVFLDGKPQEYAYALEQHWLGGKKNDVIVLIDTAGGMIDWVYVMAWTDSQMFKVKLRDDILAIGQIDQTKIFDAMRQNISSLYLRKPMKDFQYLEASITPTPTQYAVCIVLGTILAIGLGVVFYKNDVDFINS